MFYRVEQLLNIQVKPCPFHWNIILSEKFTCTHGIDFRVLPISIIILVLTLGVGLDFFKFIPQLNILQKFV